MKGERKFREGLSPRLDTLFMALRREDDVAIAELYAMLFEKPHTLLRQQMALGSLISRLNAKLCEEGYVVRPGIARRTYRMYRLEAAPRKRRVRFKHERA